MAEKKNAKKRAERAEYITNDWSFYRPKELVKVGYDKSKPGKLLVLSRDGKVKEVDEEKFLADYEPAPSSLKSANF